MLPQVPENPSVALSSNDRAYIQRRRRRALANRRAERRAFLRRNAFVALVFTFYFLALSYVGGMQ